MCSEEQTVVCTLGYSQLSLFHNSVQESGVYFHLRGISIYPDIPFLLHASVPNLHWYYCKSWSVIPILYKVSSTKFVKQNC